MKYHIIALGSEIAPDLDYFSDEIPSDLHSKYRFVDVAMLEPILLKDIKADLLTDV